MKKFFVLVLLLVILFGGCSEQPDGGAIKSLSEKKISEPVKVFEPVKPPEPICQSSIEVCDEIDNDCDGEVDEGVCLCGDVDKDNEINKGDVIYLIDFLYSAGPLPCNPGQDYVLKSELSTKEEILDYLRERQRNPIQKSPPHPSLLKNIRGEAEREFEPYLCGDVDMDDKVDVEDIMYLVDYVFDSGPSPDCKLVSADLSHFVELNLDARQRGLDQPSEFDMSKLLKSKAWTGQFKILAVLIQFTDKPKQVGAEFFDSLLFDETQVSLRHYYLENSYNQLDIITVNLPLSMGWQTAPETYAYYVNGQYGTGPYPQNTQKLTEDIVDLIDPIIDFSNYDNDGDSYVDGLMLVHTGPGAEFTSSPDDIWSHKWGIIPRQKDGVYISQYSIQPEYWITPGDMTIGVIAHETGHLFGLPDLYDTDYSSSGIGKWSVMAFGSWNGPYGLGGSPSHLDAWSKVELGFVNPQTVAVSPSTFQIPDIETNDIIFRLWNNNLIGDEYFLVENRQKIGYDSYIPKEGLLIWHVDEAKWGNKQEWWPGLDPLNHYKVALEQAEGNWDLERKVNKGDSTDPYSNITPQNCIFNLNSLPSSKSYEEQDSSVCVEFVSDSGSYVTTALSVGGDCYHVFTDADSDGYSVCEGDCDDTDPNMFPGNPEICDGKDNDCNGLVDNVNIYYYDGDGDGYGVDYSTEQGCTLPPNHAYVDGDCNDNDPNINPGIDEVCGNKIDDNCNNLIDDEDIDGDGYYICSGALDCNDNNPNINPGAHELGWNGIDDNCNGLIDCGDPSVIEDYDGDGYSVCIDDCKDNNPNINPGMIEVCGNGADDDCNGLTDHQEVQCRCEGNGGVCKPFSQNNPCPAEPGEMELEPATGPEYYCSPGEQCCVFETPQLK